MQWVRLHMTRLVSESYEHSVPEPTHPLSRFIAMPGKIGVM
jgi:hypothetical protein